MRKTDFTGPKRAVGGPLAEVLDDQATPRIRELLLRQIDENEQLSTALLQMRERIEELERLVDSDTLTPLPNRRRFVREVERAVQHGRRYGSKTWVMFVDLDGLKAINDNYGHLAGDAALIHVSKMLQAMVRTTDVVARIGGDEFGLLLENIEPEDACGKAAKLSAAIAAEEFVVGGKRIKLSVSIGLAELGADDDVDQLIGRADSAMYAARAQIRSAK